MRGLAQIEVPDTADEQIGNGKIEETAHNIDRRRGQAYPGRRREGALEGISRDSVAEMRQGVRQEYAAEEIRNIVIPAHVVPFLITNDI
jgi:hypothetical protein